jgi:hypothetical protein
MRALLSDSGIDTIRFRWREDNVAYHHFERRPEGTFEGHRGERYVQTHLGRLGVFPDGLHYLEGRAAAILARDPDDHSLAPAHSLIAAEQAALDFVREQGAYIPDGSPARLGRIDLASELRFSDGSEGGAFLHSLAALDVPWCKTRVDGRKGDYVETVSFHGTRGKTIYLRAYDKGVESGTAKPGTRIRVERQKRFRKEREPSASLYRLADLRKAYLGREFEKLSTLPSVVISDLPGALQAVIQRSETVAQAERLAGYLVLGNWIDYEWRTEYRRQAELRELGIYVDPGQHEVMEVPVGTYLQTLGSAWEAA